MASASVLRGPEAERFLKGQAIFAPLPFTQLLKMLKYLPNIAYNQSRPTVHKKKTRAQCMREREQTD